MLIILVSYVRCVQCGPGCSFGGIVTGPGLHSSNGDARQRPFGTGRVFLGCVPNRKE